MPTDYVLLRNENICTPISKEINQPDIRMAPVQVGKRLERAERIPARVAVSTKEAGHQTVEIDQVLVAIAAEVHEGLKDGDGFSLSTRLGPNLARPRFA